MLISNCCSAPLIHPDIEMCSACKEHCEGIESEPLPTSPMTTNDNHTKIVAKGHDGEIITILDSRHVDMEAGYESHNQADAENFLVNPDEKPKQKRDTSNDDDFTDNE